MKRLFTSCFGLGLLPIMPGTWGCLPVVFAFAVTAYASRSAILQSLVMAALVLAGSVVCVAFAPAIIALTGRKDPREVVADECAGQAVSFLAVPLLAGGTLSQSQILTITIAGFLLFRAFDIVKPWPVRQLEQLPAGWGILCDDLMAGVYAAVGVFAVVRLLAP